MESIKKYFGLICLLGGVMMAVYLPYQAIIKFSSDKATSEDYIFWGVIVTIFIPITIGFILFGYYALKGEYNKI